MGSITSPKPKTGGARLRELLSQTGNMVLAPGVFDGITARVGLATGFDALYMTGAGTSMSRLGWADLGMATMTDMSSNAGMIAGLDPGVPVIADADTGYGGPIMVTRTVEAYAQAGVAAMHLEDQVQEKRCGHLLGKELVSREIFYSRIRAAVNARDALGSDMMIIARTDARQGLGFDEALERLRGAVEIGADAVFPEAMATKEEVRRVVEELKGTPVLLNMVSKGVTPEMSVDEGRELGVRIMIFPALSIEASMWGTKLAMEKLKNEGSCPMDHSHGVKALFNMCGLQRCIEIDKRAGGKAFSGV